MDNQNRRANDKRAPGTVEWDESSKPATSAPAPVSPTDLRDAIMHLPCNPPGGRGAIQHNGYVTGHRDARHGAAELAASFKIAPAAADSPSTASDELHIGVSNNDQGVHINIIQRHSDGTAIVIYSAKAPTGDSYGRASLATQSAKQGAQPDNWPDFIKDCGYIETAPGKFSKPPASQAAPEQAAQVQPDVRDEAPTESATDEAMQRACRDLPEFYRVHVELENGCGCVVWHDQFGASHDIEGEGHLSDDINQAVDLAIEDAAMKSNRAASTDGEGADHE